MTPDHRRRPWARGGVRALAGAAVAVLASLGLAHPASADDIDDIGKKLIRYEAEARQLGQGVRRPADLSAGRHTADEASRRMIDARVAFGVGNYDESAILLYDLVENHEQGRTYDRALYYLAESLFQKGDHVASRTYFRKLVSEQGEQSEFYRQSLERLVELTLKLDDTSNVDRWLRRLGALPRGEWRSSVAYVRGKYAYFSDQPRDAIASFQRVGSDSEYYLQAGYFVGSSYVTLGNLPRAAEVFGKVVAHEPETAEEKRVVELAHMALGRLHYERGQASRAVDRYLEISRHSDLFDEALYEVAWVYVKGDDFDKALRALELLSLTDPTSSKLPDVRILEGNLRIRKAQHLAETGKAGNSAEEYAEAIDAFESTKAAYEDPRHELERLLEEHEDPRQFLDQITGRASGAFDTSTAALPEVAAAWLRDEPQVERVVGIERNLGQIQNEIETAEATMARLEHALGPENKANIFPKLAEKRARATEIMEHVVGLRTELAAREHELVASHADPGEKARLEELRGKRRRIEAELAELPGAGLPYTERIQRARQRFTEVDKEASKVRTVVQAAEAELTALSKYLEQQGMPDAEPADVAEIKQRMRELEREIEGMRGELEALQRATTLARDAAGAARETRARELHADLRRALDEEHRLMRDIGSRMAAGERTESEQIASLNRKANSITLELEEVTSTVDDIVDTVLVDVRRSLDDERAKLAAYEREFESYQTESRELGGTVLADGFAAVAAKFRDVLIRADVGVVDVAWSQKEAADETTRRLTLDRAREIKTLDTDYREVIRQHQQREAEDRREAREAGAGNAGGQP